MFNTSKFLETIDIIVSNDVLHAKWLNSLSLMENTGAKKISASQDPVRVSLDGLKHAAEESRHALFFKQQINRVQKQKESWDYQDAYLLAPIQSAQYLNRLDVVVCRYLKKNDKNISQEKLKYLAYLLVTYLIEIRAETIYSLYQKMLAQKKCPISVKMILDEESNHLNDMRSALENELVDWKITIKVLANEEKKIFEQWFANLLK